MEELPEEENAPSFIDNLKAKFHDGVEFLSKLGKPDYDDVVDDNKSDGASITSGSSDWSETTCTTRTSAKSVGCTRDPLSL